MHDVFITPVFFFYVVLTVVGFSGSTDYTKRRANGVASEWNYKNQKSIYGVNFRAGIFDRVIRVRVIEVLPF